MLINSVQIASNEGHTKEARLLSADTALRAIHESGSRTEVVKTEYGCVGMSTCYDLRFPEQFRKITDQGAEFFLVASAWPLARVDHWKLFNRVRAVENQAYLISCNGTGTIDGSQLGGHSMITDPWGNVLAAGDEEEGIVSADIDPSEVKKNRDSFPALKDRRPI